MSEPGRVRRKLGELALEAAMVVFAVLIALGFEELREERQMLDFATRAEEAVLAEVGANLEAMRDTRPGLDSITALLAEVVEQDDLALLEGLDIDLPDISSAAWRAAQVSQAAPYLDYDWVIRVSRAYEAHDIYSGMARGIIEEMAGIVARPPSVEGMNAIYARLVLLNGVHRQVESRLEMILEGDEGDTTP